MTAGICAGSRDRLDSEIREMKDERDKEARRQIIETLEGMAQAQKVAIDEVDAAFKRYCIEEGPTRERRGLGVKLDPEAVRAAFRKRAEKLLQPKRQFEETLPLNATRVLRRHRARLRSMEFYATRVGILPMPTRVA